MKTRRVIRLVGEEMIDFTIGFEIDKSYYDIAQDRINGITQVERREKEAGIMNIFDFVEEKEDETNNI